MPTEYCMDNTFMVRTPVLNLEVLKEISACNSLKTLLRSYYTRDIIREALFLSSPALYRKTMVWIKQDEQDKKLEATLLMYLIRMSSRSTPFGLFAGISSGTLGERNKMASITPGDHELHVRYDYQIICKLLEQLAKDHGPDNEYKLFPNSSLYRIGDEYRYIEYYYGNDSIRHYKLQSTSFTSELESILQSAIKGASASGLANILMEEGIDKYDAKKYIHALIDNQVLVSEIEPMVNGSSTQIRLSDYLNNMNGYSKKLIIKLNNIVNTPFNKHSQRVTMFEEVIGDLRSNDFPYKENAVFQADLNLRLSSGELHHNTKKELLELLPVLMKLSRPEDNPLLDSFKERFLRRFRSREVPLMLALDDEAGPGYTAIESLPGDSDLLKGIKIFGRPDQKRKLVFTIIDNYLYRQLTDALTLGSYEVEINQAEISELPDPEYPFPSTMSIMARILDESDDVQNIQIISAGGASALNLAGRFCHMDEELEKAMRRMAQKEVEAAGDCVVAEILHLPQQRTGNILFRPTFYDYEIPFLARSGKAPDFQIAVSDLMVSIANNKVFLRSKRLNKFIIPRLSNAHNYKHGSLALYHFLCDLQTQDICTSLGFTWGPLEKETIFLPRVRYRKIILSPASWNLQKRHFEIFLTKDHAEGRYEAIKKLRDVYHIPQLVLLCEADNELWLDLQHPDCLELLFRELHGREQILLKEYFGGSIVNGDHGKFANEFVFFLYSK